MSKDISMMNGKAGENPAALAGPENVPDESDYPHPNNASQQIFEDHNNSRRIAAPAVGVSVDVDRVPSAACINPKLMNRRTHPTYGNHTV